MASETSRLDHYIVLKTLGKGLTAKVKSIQDPNTLEIFAAKILKCQGESITSRFRDVMQNEMVSLNRVQHPNVLNLVNANENGVYVKKQGRGIYNCMYMVMELCSNGELFDILFNTGRFSEPIARFYFKQIIESLNACHTAGLAHRDMKPENILFDNAFNLKIADFGFSIILSGRDGTGILHTRLGTESYMAPELHERKPYTGESVDLFAAGIILFIMLSQNPPFSKADKNDAYYRLLYTGEEKFWNLHSRSKPAGFYSADFRSLIFKMLAYDPRNRLSIEEIKAHPWTNGPTATQEEVFTEVSERKRRIVEAAERARAQRRPVQGVAFNNGRYYRGDVSESTGLSLSFTVPIEDFEVKPLPTNESYLKKYSQILTGLYPKEIMTIVSNELGAREEATIEISKNSHDVKATIVTEEGLLVFKSSIYQAPDDLYLLDFTLFEGNHFDLFKIFRNIADKIEEAQST